MLTMSEARHASLHRPEQETLAQFLNQLGEEAITEYKIERDDAFRCRLCSKEFTFYDSAENHSHILHEPSLLEQKFYLLDIYLPHKKISIELNGKAHDSAKQEQKDEQKYKFLETLGIRTLTFPSEDLVYPTNSKKHRKGDPKLELIESIARVLTVK